MKERFEMRAEKEWIDKLDAYAAQRGLSRAAAARKLMERALKLEIALNGKPCG